VTRVTRNEWLMGPPRGRPAERFVHENSQKTLFRPQDRFSGPTYTA
jgi:hypothetical protein